MADNNNNNNNNGDDNRRAQAQAGKRRNFINRRELYSFEEKANGQVYVVFVAS